ncbi:MAG: hypothetical protein VYD19_00425, partial [Myxococcota bacterium]|nr:hypothetical protein [Myxococcota bacterium]
TVAKPTPAATPAPTKSPVAQRFGAWLLRNDDAGVLIEYPAENDTQIFFPKESAEGEFFLANRSGQFKVSSADRSSEAPFPTQSIGLRAPQTERLPASMNGTRQVGTWTLEQKEDELFLRHPKNDFYLRLWRDSNGWWDIRFQDGRDEKTIFSASRP